MKKLLLLFLLLVLRTLAYAQQYPDISQFMFNKLYYNPAAAGANEFFQASMLFKTQWLGMAGAPNTQLFSADSRIKETGLSWGALAFNSHTGVTDQTQISASGSYKIRMNENSFLSFGLRFGLMHYQSNLTNLTVWDPNDPNFANNINSAYLPKIGTGLYFQNLKFYAGISTPDLITYDPNKIFTNHISNTSDVKKNYILQSGYKMALGPRVNFTPNLLMIYYPTSPLYVKLNANFTLHDQFTLGATYGVANSYGVLVQVALNSRLKIGYNFELKTNFNHIPFTNHEIMLYYGLQGN